MKDLSLTKLMATVTCACTVMFASSASYAGQSADEWQHSVNIYAWIPTIEGQLKYDLGGGDDTEIEAEDILDALSGVFMGDYLVRKGKVSFLVDLIYINLEDTSGSSIPLPGGGEFASRVELGLKGLQVGLYGGYNIYQTTQASVDLIGGLRYLSLDTDAELKLTGPLPPTLPSAKFSRDIDLWDGVIGVRGRAKINDRWFMPFHADVGAGDSDLTWQVIGGIGYAADWGDITASYRHLSWDQGDDDLIQELNFSGPSMGVTFHF